MKYIYLHGFLSGPESVKGGFLAERFAQHGIRLQRPDLKGADYQHMTLTSMLAVVEELLAADDQPATLLGSSLGGFLSLILADRWKQVQRVVLMAPAFRFMERFRAGLPPGLMEQWRERGYTELFFFSFNENRRLYYDIIEDAGQYRGFVPARQLPVQIFHGIRDEVVPYTLSVEYLQSHPMADVILLNTDHGLLDKLDVMWDYLTAFLRLPDGG